MRYIALTVVCLYRHYIYRQIQTVNIWIIAFRVSVLLTDVAINLVLKFTFVLSKYNCEYTQRRWQKIFQGGWGNRNSSRINY